MGSNEGLCWRCGEIEPHGMDCGCPGDPCYGLHHDHIADATQKVQPAPAPLPGSEELAEALAEISAAGLDAVAKGLRLYISDLTRRLAEAEAGNGRFADMLGSSVVDWRKLYAEERAERVRIQHILMDDVQSERQESDEHIKGLNTIIATQDKNIGDLKAHIQRIEVDHDDVESRAEAAEARVRELEREACEALAGAHAEHEVSRHWKEEAQWEQTKRKCAEARVRELVAEAAKRPLASDDEQTIADLEAFKARVMEWASERCICGLVGKACPKGMFDGETKWATSGPCPNWTPPQAWEVGE